jgi:hypothetical protein
MNEMMIGAIAFQQLQTLDSQLLENTCNAKCTLKVQENKPAMEVAIEALRMNAGLIITLDMTGNVTGIVAPDWVLNQYSRMKGLHFPSFVDALDIVEKDPDERARGYHHEWLNVDKPDLYRCPKGHLVSSKPCPDHGL